MSIKSRPSLGTDCQCGHTYNWHVPNGICQVPNCVCKKHVTADKPKDPS
jgi:hypothetical protein